MRAGFLGTTATNREDFVITRNQLLESGRFILGEAVRIDVDVEAVLQTDR